MAKKGRRKVITPHFFLRSSVHAHNAIFLIQRRVLNFLFLISMKYVKHQRISALSSRTISLSWNGTQFLDNPAEQSIDIEIESRTSTKTNCTSVQYSTVQLDCGVRNHISSKVLILFGGIPVSQSASQSPSCLLLSFLH